jgi:hypothetical protein
MLIRHTSRPALELHQKFPFANGGMDHTYRVCPSSPVNAIRASHCIASYKTPVPAPVISVTQVPAVLSITPLSMPQGVYLI